MTSAQSQDAAEITAILTSMGVPCAVMHSAHQGKFMSSLEDIPSGTVLLEEVPLVCWPMDAFIKHNISFCWHCLHILDGPLASGAADEGNERRRCAKMCGAVFCSSGCFAASEIAHEVLCGAERSLREFHCKEIQRMAGGVADDAPISDDSSSIQISVESLARCVATMVSRFVRLMLRQTPPGDAALHRLVFEAAVKPLNRLVEPPKGSVFDNLDPQLWFSEVRAAMEENVRRVLRHHCPEHIASQQVLDEIVAGFLSADTLNTLLGQLTINGQSINVAVESTGGENASDHPGTVYASIGGGLYTIQSVCNHACSPNAEVIHTNQSHEIAIRTKAAVKKGEEICISYIPSGLPLTERKKRLAAYFFACECAVCGKDEALTKSHFDPSQTNL